MKTLVTWMSLVVLTVGVVFIACENAPEGTVAKVGKYTISADELEDNVARMKPRWKTVEEAFEGRMGALDNIIRQKLLLLGAYKEGLDKDSTVLLSLENNENRRKLIALWEEEIVNKVTITDEELMNMYNQRAQEYNAAHILVKDSALAVELREKIQEGADFAELAKEYSEDPGSGSQGGDLGWFTVGRMVKPFEDAVLALEENEISEPVKTRFGWHIIMRKGTRKNANLKPFEEEKDMLKRTLEKTKQQERMMEYLDECHKRAGLTFNEENMKLVLEKFAEMDAEDQPGAMLVFTKEERALPLANWNTGTWTIGQFDSIYSSMSPMRRQVFTTIEELTEFVKLMAQEGILLAEAEKINIMGTEKYREMYNDELEREMLRVFQTDIYKNVDVTEEEMRAYYEANIDSFMAPRTVVVREVQISSESEANKIYDKVKAGTDIGKLADKQSERSYLKGRDWILELTERRYPLLYKAVADAKSGDIVGPVKDRTEKWSVMEVMEIREPEPRPYEQVSSTIQSKLNQRKRQTIMDEYLESAREQFNVKIYESAIAALIDSSRFESVPEPATPPTPGTVNPVNP